MKKQFALISAVILTVLLSVGCDPAGSDPSADGDSGTETSAARPWDDVDSGDIILISSIGEWTEGSSIDSEGETDWFKFKADDSYYILNWQDSDNSSLTCNVMVSVFNLDGTLLFGPKDNGTTDEITVEEYNDYTSGEYIYIKVEGKNADSTGTYSLYFS